MRPLLGFAAGLITTGLLLVSTGLAPSMTRDGSNAGPIYSYDSPGTPTTTSTNVRAAALRVDDRSAQLPGAQIVASSGRLAARGGTRIHWGAQEKHFLGHSKYISGRSQLTADPRKLAERAGSGQPVGSVPRGQPGFRERIDFGEAIGTYVDPVTGAETTTSRGILHYGKRGIHIVPARP